MIDGLQCGPNPSGVAWVEQEHIWEYLSRSDKSLRGTGARCNAEGVWREVRCPFKAPPLHSDHIGGCRIFTPTLPPSSFALTLTYILPLPPPPPAYVRS